ncbi:MAG: SDR family oxidoreductase [Anaerolineae bacterium]
MDFGLEGKVALVAASSRGLGKAAAREISREGADVVISARGKSTLKEAAEEIWQETGGRVLPVQADVTLEKDIESLIEAAESEFGQVDVLVNNAGGPKPGTFTDMSDEDWLGAINLNLMSTIRLTRLVLPGMRARRWGRIINITSFSVKQPIPDIILSNTARAGVAAMAKTLAGQVADEGITVNNVCPGYILTDRVRNLAASTAQEEGTETKEILADWESRIPADRLGKPEELAALITFLASERASYITGTTIQVDGGLIKSLL